jgi:hypothetical protein
MHKEFEQQFGVVVEGCSHKKLIPVLYIVAKVCTSFQATRLIHHYLTRSTNSASLSMPALR